MASPANAPIHDLGSLRIHEGARKGGRLGKGLAIFFGGLVVLANLADGCYQAGDVAVLQTGRRPRWPR